MTIRRSLVIPTDPYAGSKPDCALAPAVPAGYDGGRIYGRSISPATVAALAAAGALPPQVGSAFTPLGGAFAPLNGLAPVGLAPVGAGPEPYDPRDDSVIIIGQAGFDEDMQGNEVVLLVGASKATGQIKNLVARTGRKAPVQLRGGSVLMRNESTPYQNAVAVAADELGQPRDGLVFGDTANPAAAAAFTLTMTPQCDVRLDNFQLMASVDLATVLITNIAVGTQPLFGNTQATANGILATAYSPDNTATNNMRGRQLRAQTPLVITGTNLNAAQQRISVKADGTAIEGAIRGAFATGLPARSVASLYPGR